MEGCAVYLEDGARKKYLPLLQKFTAMHREKAEQYGNQKNNRRKQLYEMEKQLEELEQELSVLVLSAEMHK